MKIRTSSLMAAACLLILVVPPLSGALGPGDVRSEVGPWILMDHNPIVISSDADFTTQAASEPWSGSGTEGDPYIIQGYRINASTVNYGIQISGTTVHFIVQSCQVLDTSLGMAYGTGTGIRFDNVQHGNVKYLQILKSKRCGIDIYGSKNITLDNTTVEGARSANGFCIKRSDNIAITKCTMVENEMGLYLEESTGTFKGCNITKSIYSGIELYRASGWKFEDNRIEDAAENGVYLRSGSINNEFHRNTFINCSFSLYGEVEVFTTNHIPIDNTVNGLPVHQIKDHTGSGEELSIYSGQLILGNVSDVVIRGMNISRASEAVTLGHCSRVKVVGCNLSNNEKGLWTIGGDNISVEDCLFLDCDRAGAILQETNDGTVQNCLFKGGELGIYAGDDLIRFKVLDNRMEGNENGIFLGGALEALVSNNSIIGPSRYGIYLEYVFDSILEGNRLICEMGPLPPGDGVFAHNTKRLEMKGNFIKDADQGLHFEEVFDTEVINNTLDSCVNDSVVIDGSDGCLVHGNLFYNSGGLGLTFVSHEGPTMDNLIWGNSFLFNNGTTTVHQSGRYQASDAAPSDNWTSAIDGKGNHWSDWTTPDIDGDRIVDLPYALEGGRNDTRPLVHDPLLHVTPPTRVLAVSMRDSVNISWTKPTFTRSGQISGYRVFKAQEGQVSTLLAELLSDTGYFVDSEVSSGVQYNYSVLAYNSYGSGDMSKVVFGSPDSTPPEIMISAPKNGSFWNVTSVEASWEGSDDVDVVGFRYRTDLGPWTEMGLVNTTIITNLSQGDHLLTVECYDGLNNSGQTNISFHIDLTNPEVEIIEPQEGLITALGSMNITYVGEDLPYSVSFYRWRLDDEGWLVTNGTFVELEDLSDGHHTFHLEVIDLAGNIGYDRTTFTIDTISPVVKVLNPSEGEVFLGRPILATWAIEKTGTSITGVRTKLDSGPWRDIGLAFNETLMGLEIGNHSYWVSAADQAGNTGTATVSFRVGSEIPEPPTPGKGLIFGRVLDKDGDPLHKVKVRSDTGEEAFTDSEGYFFIEVPAGMRTLTFSKRDFREYDKIIEVEENRTLLMDPIAMERSTVEERDGMEWWQYCLCCLLPFVVLFFMFLILGTIARIRKSRSRKLDEE